MLTLSGHCRSPRADIDSSDESDVEEDVDQPSAHKMKHDLMMKGEGSRKGSFFKQAKKSYPMFPAPEERIKWDEYGEIIKYVPRARPLPPPPVRVHGLTLPALGPGSLQLLCPVFVSLYRGLKNTEDF